MNICKCGCGKECKNTFVRGHNKRKAPVQSEETVEQVEETTQVNKETVPIEGFVEPESSVEEEVPVKEEFIPQENYTLTNVRKDDIINYDAGKKWLDKHYENYSVRLLHDEENLPSEIVLSAWVFKEVIKEEEQLEKIYTIGKGTTFSNALKEILINT